MSQFSTANQNQSKKSYVYERIRDEIINNTLKAGEPLVERTICATMDISRTPVREALQRLATEGLVEFLPGNIAQVSHVTYEGIIDVYNIREVLEGLACRISANIISPEQLHALEQLLTQYESIEFEGSYLDYNSFDIKFHNIIIESCKSAMLINMINIIQNHVRRITNLQTHAKAYEMAIKAHRSILDALKNHDPEAAESLMREHIRFSKQQHISDMYLHM